MSFLMIVSLAYVTIEKIDPEPAFAVGEFDCVDSDGRTYLYQSTWSSGTLTINRGINDDSGNFTSSVIETFDTWDLGNIDEVNSLSITTDGEMYAILKRTNTSQVYLYKLNYNASGDGTTTRISSIDIGTGDNNAASNYEVDSGGTTYKYIFTSKGFFNGNQKVIRINGDGTYKVITPTITNGGNGSNKAKDFAWVSNHPSGNDFVGYDSNANDLLGAEITSHTNIGASNEAITIDLSVINGNIGTGIGSNSGAAMSLGNGDVYFLENSTGDLWFYNQDAGTLAETNDDFSSSSNTDGAGCGIGLQGGDEFVPTVTAVQGSCSGTNKPVAVTLNNSGSDVAANFVVTYTIGGSTSNLTTGTSVNGGASNTSLSVPAQANGTSVQLNWYAESTTYGLRTPASGTSTVTVTIDTSDCGPGTPTLSVTQSLGACSTGGGTQTSTLSITNNSGASAYVKVEYSTNGGSSYSTASSNLEVGSGVTNTSLTVAVSHGSAITWRYKASDTSGDWTGISYSTLSASSTVDCDPDATVSQSLGSCSAANGSQTSTLSIRNDESSTVYYLVEYSTNGGSSYSTASSNLEVGSGVTNTSLSQAVSHGSSIIWRYKDSNVSGSFGSASYTTLTASGTVDCDPALTVSQSLGNCSASGGYQTSTLSIENTESYTVYVYVEYSLNGGSSWTDHPSAEESDGFTVAAGQTDTSLTVNVPDGFAITWRYKDSPTSSFSGATQSTLSASDTVDCTVGVSVSQSLGSCSAGSKTSTLSITNNESYTAYVYVEYSLDGGSTYSDHPSAEDSDNLTIGAGATNTDLTISVAHNQTVIWRVTPSPTTSSSGASTTSTTESSAVDCPVIDVGGSASFASLCQNGAKISTFTMTNSSNANTTAYFKVEYSLDDGSSYSTAVANQSVSENGSATVTQSVSDGQTIIWRYEASTTNNTYTGTPTATLSASSEVDCGNATVSAALGSCSSGSATSTLTLTNPQTTSVTVYFEVQYKVTDTAGNDGSWQNKLSSQSVSPAGSSSTTQSISDGEKITWRYRTSNESGTFSGSYTETSQSSAVNCTIDPGGSQALAASCTGSSKISTLTITNSSSATTTAYFLVEYSTDGGSSYSVAESSKAVSINGSETVTQSVASGKAIIWRYKTSKTDGSFSSSYTTLSASDTVSCATPAASGSQGSCSSGSANITMELDNRNQLIVHHFKVEYSTDGGSTYTTGDNDLSDKSVLAGAVTTVSLKSSAISHGTTVKLRYYTSTSSDFSGSTAVDLTDITIDCPVLSGSATASAASCSSGSATIPITLNNSGSNVAGTFTVRYSTDSGSSYTTLTATSVAAGQTDTSSLSVPAQSHGTAVIIKYSVANTSEGLSQSEATLSTITISCPVSAIAVTSSTNGCGNNGVGQGGVYGNSVISIDNSGSNVAVTLYVQKRKVNAVTGNEIAFAYFANGTTGGASGQSISAGASSSYSFDSHPHGTEIQYRWSTDGSNWTNLSTFTVSCANVSTSAGTCSNDTGKQTPTITLSSGSQATVSVFFKVEYSIDSGSNWVTLKSDEEVPANTSETYSGPELTNGESIQWRYSSRKSGGAHDDASMVTDDTNIPGVDPTLSYTSSCTVTTTTTILTIDPSVSNTRDACSEGAKLTHFNMANSGSANTNAYFFVEYSLDGGDNWSTLVANQSVAPNSSEKASVNVPNGQNVRWRYKTSTTSNSFSGGYKNWGPDFTVDCPTTTTTTTTLPTTTTQEEEDPIFKPILNDNQQCNADGTASFGFTLNNTQSTVGTILKVRMFINNVKIYNTGRLDVPAGGYEYINETRGVPEGSIYKLRFIIRDELTNKRTTGSIYKVINCIDEDDQTPSSTTTTLPSPTTSIFIDPDLFPTTTIQLDPDLTDPDPPTDPFIDEFCEDMILEDDDVCEGPLTDEEGNDFLQWEEFDDDVYLTDGSYLVTYIYREDSLSLAATGINLDYIALGGSVFLIGGVVLYTSSRKRKLMESEISLEDIYKHSFKVKTKIEKLIKEKVEINIDINKFAPYAKSFTTYQSEIQELDNELKYTLVAIENIKTNCEKENKELTKVVLEDSLSLISNNFQIIYSGEGLDSKLKVENEVVSKKDVKKIKRKFFERKQLKRPALGLAILSIITGMGFGIYATQQMFLSNVQQDNAQAYLEKMYLGEEIKEVNRPEILTNPLRLFQNDNPVFETLQDFIVIDQSAKIEEFQPTIFGLLEIPDINISQFVVSGTDELSLKFGPGHYIGTKLPGSGGNVGIAGHRTTYGAPFSRLDQVDIGDEIYLTVGLNKYHYIVDDIEVVDANTGDYVLFNRGDDRLTLTTCHPRYSARERLIVSGILTRIESGN